MPDISDQFGEKTVALSIKSAKLDAKVLAKAIQILLKGGNNLVKKIKTPKDMTSKGKQTVKELVRQGQGVSNIEINNKNIKSFESVARKYGVDFALKKDKTTTPPKWLVFFKAKDADALTAAFNEYSKVTLKRQKSKEPSLLSVLQKAKELVGQIAAPIKTRQHGEREL